MVEAKLCGSIPPCCGDGVNSKRKEAIPAGHLQYSPLQDPTANVQGGQRPASLGRHCSNVGALDRPLEPYLEETAPHSVIG